MQSIIANYYFQQESLRYIIKVILVVTWGGGRFISTSSLPTSVHSYH